MRHPGRAPGARGERLGEVAIPLQIPRPVLGEEREIREEEIIHERFGILECVRGSVVRVDERGVELEYVVLLLLVYCHYFFDVAVIVSVRHYNNTQFDL